MNVCVEILFEIPNEHAWDVMDTLGRHVTNDERSVRVSASGEGPNWLTIEFTMPTEAHYKAAEKVGHAVRLCAWQRMDSMISFPRSEAERLRAQRKAERRRAKRREAKGDPA